MGSQPYVAWHYAVEGTALPFFTDVAYQLASKVTLTLISKARYVSYNGFFIKVSWKRLLKNLCDHFFSGWLGWGSSAKVDNAPKKNADRQTIEPGAPVYPKLGLADSLREALTVVMSSNEKLAAVTDSLGRVILIDIFKGIAVRIWKGMHLLTKN